jgi:hypothetical protein
MVKSAMVNAGGRNKKMQKICENAYAKRDFTYENAAALRVRDTKRCHINQIRAPNGLRSPQGRQEFPVLLQ